MLYILAIVCPPVAVLVAGGSKRAAVNAGLTLLLYVPGLVHAMSTVGRHYIDRRNEALLRAVALQYA